MNLIIDTSGEELVCILCDKDCCIKSPKIKEKHGVNLLPQIDNLLKEKNCQILDIDNFATVVGPGSFTGIRLGVATVKAINLVEKKNIISINILELLIKKVLKEKELDHFFVIRKSTSSKIYVGEYKDKDISYYSTLTLPFLEKNKENVFTYEFKIEGIEEITLCDKDYIDFVNDKIQKSDFVKSQNLEPLYLALSQAEENLKNE